MSRSQISTWRYRLHNREFDPGRRQKEKALKTLEYQILSKIYFAPQEFSLPILSFLQQVYDK